MEAVCPSETVVPTHWTATAHNPEKYSKKLQALENLNHHSLILGARCWWRSWLRHCATNRKVADSIPDGVIGILIDVILPAALWPWGLTQPLTEMSTRNISWG